MKTIGLVAHARKPRAAELVQLLADGFATRGVELLMERVTAELIGREGCSVEELGRRVSMLVVLGGDGSLLRAVHHLGEAICPVFGINLGSLGFLTCVNSLSWQEAVDAICNSRFVLSQRSLLAVEVVRGGESVYQSFALNDAVVGRGRFSRLIKLDTAIDGAILTQYNADGLIVATPTGSTAYSLSAAGPVVLPQSGVFLINPICPHVLTNRTVIVSDESEITVRPEAGQRGIVLTVDGQAPVSIKAGDTIRLTKSSRKLPLAMMPGLSFSEVLRQKLKWSGTAL
ncbi:MAG TPA: NAD(+)/NADH kinase [Chthoniobacteraceae bacterium]|nr:NAD(+)/NADH kinase [Chthoniobacteraceae bacterium]